MAFLDPAAADGVHYATDPRIRHLAEAAWRMRTGGSRTDWLCLGKDNPEALIASAREWVRAAVAGVSCRLRRMTRRGGRLPTVWRKPTLHVFLPNALETSLRDR